MLYNEQKVNKVLNVSLISRGFQEHGMKITYPFHFTGFDTLLENNKEEADMVVEDMLCTTL